MARVVNHFSKQDYEAIARIIADVERQQSATPLLTLACRLADLFGKDNMQFDRDRFIKACNPTKGDR